jgi:hypothetical protein
MTMSIITRCPHCGDDMLADDLDSAFVALAFEAIVTTIGATGFLPVRIEESAAFLVKWRELIRAHNTRLRNLSDREIAVIICYLADHVPEASAAAA